MAKSSGLKNAPSTTGRLSGGNRGNNTPKPQTTSVNITKPKSK